MFGWIRKRRRRRLAARELPAAWLSILNRRVPFFGHFSADEQVRFLRMLKIFVWEKHWIEGPGMSIDDEVRVVVAATAVRLGLYLEDSIYNRLTEIVIYPSHYHHPDDSSVILGEAHAWGTVVLSWDAVLGGLANPSDGHDTATHEFAHVLDRNTGRFDGTPRLRTKADYRPWALVLDRHFQRLRKGNRPELRVLREYGGTNEAEFFAVATEAFFEKPKQMLEEIPDLYGELREFYGCDPAW